MFPKYLIEYQIVKIKKSKFKSEESNKNKHKSDVVLKINNKKSIKIDMMSVTWPLNICLLILCVRTCEHCNSFIKKYIKIRYCIFQLFTCGLKILFLYNCASINITQKNYNKMHLNAILAHIFFFLIHCVFWHGYFS